jgi:hypothetical protein
VAQHISIRIPWHDNGYNGTVCKNPCGNTACLRLKNIYENRDQEFEQALSETSMSGNEQKLVCISEGGACMSPQSLYRTTVHNYKKGGSKQHQHFQETELEYPAYSLPARPFRWMMKNDTGYDYSHYGIKFDESHEPVLDFRTDWVQDADNHRAIFDYFYHDVAPGKSLCVLYSKQVSFVEDNRRVIMGIGFVDKIVPAPEHNHTDEGKLRSMVWETMICHSIREDCKNGFMMPYTELMAYAEEHAEFNITESVVFEPESCRDEFSYVTEHLTYDSLIEVLLTTRKAFNLIKDIRLSGKDWTDCINWINERIDEVWQDRGIFPGLGPMLLAAGFHSGILIAEKLKKEFGENEDFWRKLDSLIVHLSSDVSSIERKTWKNSITGERRDLFKLLSRISLSTVQAKTIFDPAERNKAELTFTDKEIIDDPYILYERTRECGERFHISIRKIDNAMFPPAILRKMRPQETLSLLESENDERRIRAIMISELETKAEIGHTVYPAENLVLEINTLPIYPVCLVTTDILDAITDFLSPEIISIEMKNKKKAYKLKRFAVIDKLIKDIVEARIDSQPLEIEVDWHGILYSHFGEITGDAEEIELEEKARNEKAACMKILAKSKLSVLVGGAGTGKTTLLSLFCSSPIIQNGGILVLAPTGKARVKLSMAMNKKNVRHTRQTLAQFALYNGHYKGDTGKYIINGSSSAKLPDTVIIDECSMLTEEMMGSLLELVKKAKRIILAGDPNQLPPIGAGRPFVDLVTYLRKNLAEDSFPLVCKNFCQLTVSRRQTKGIRLDVEIAKWFIPDSQVDDDIFTRLQADELKPFVRYKQWETEEDLQNCLFEIFNEELDIKSKDDVNGFNLSLGGQPRGRGIHFSTGDANGVDNWQILSPLRNLPPYGVAIINHVIHESYRSGMIKLARQVYNRKIHKPLGPENIVYADKVINIHNMKRNKKRLRPYPPHKNEDDNYIANGEIGLAVNGFINSKYFNVEFSSQPGRTYSFTESDFTEEGEAALELAYALTVHKAQGSEFKTVILIIGEPCHILSRELLYTALTRQSERLIILYNKEAHNLKAYSSDFYSDISRRFTSLFEQPDIVEVAVENKKWSFDNGLIHRTLKGHLVRSKSELVIANRLFEKNIDYEYEKELVFDGLRKSPDFTITTLAGDTFYWEHCGMMGHSGYKAHWEQKKKLYLAHGIEEGKNLIVTYDQANGGLNAQDIESAIEEYLSF